MIKAKEIKGVIFDYGGTIDTNSRHWAEVLWEKYVQTQIPVSKDVFREAYVHGERSLAKFPHIRPEHNFHDVLAIKTRLQIEYLSEHGHLKADDTVLQKYAECVTDLCYDYVLDILKTTRPVVQALAEQYKLALVSNFYGNIQTILRDFGLSEYFSHVIESAVVGVRKPNPTIYQLGVVALELPAEQVLVIGDSFSKDIVPAKSINCNAVWLKGEGWGEETVDEQLPDAIIGDLSQLLSLLS